MTDNGNANNQTMSYDWNHAVQEAFAFEFEQHKETKSAPSPTGTGVSGGIFRRRREVANSTMTANSGGNNNTVLSPSSSIELPQIIFDHRHDDGRLACCQDGSVILHLFAARIDKNAAPFQVYGKAMCLWFNQRVFQTAATTTSAAASTAVATLLLDVRSGNGWSNPKAFHMIPFVCSVAQYVYQQSPERLKKIIIYPVPHAARYIWEMAKPFLDKNMVQNVVIVPGSSERHAPPPNSKLRDYVDEMLLEKMEQMRLSLCHL